MLVLARLMVSVLLALAALSSSVNAFEIASSSPGTVNVQEGEDLELWCKADNYWEWCKITHIATDTSCEHVWNKTPYNVKVGECGDFKGRFGSMNSNFEYIGDRGASVYKCGIRVKNVRPEEAGQWKCDITEYYDGTNKWKSYADTTSKSFDVEVTSFGLSDQDDHISITDTNSMILSDATSLTLSKTTTPIIIAVSSVIVLLIGSGGR